MNKIDKIPPQAIELEEAVLGAMLIDRNCIDDIIVILKVDCFYNYANQKVYNAIQDLYNESENIDTLTVMQRLIKNNDLEAIGGAFRLTELTNKIGGSNNALNHARIVFEKYIGRELIKISHESLNLAFDESNDIFDIVNSTNNAIDKINDMMSNKSHTKTFTENVGQSITEAEIRQENRRNNVVSGISTPLKDLNKLTNGWQNTDFIVLAARPGMGKTSFALAVARESAHNNHSVAIFSLEMSAVRLTDRLVCAESDIELDKYKDGYISDVEWLKMNKVKNDLSKLNIYIDDNANADMNYIKAKARTLKKKGLCDMIIIDYIQLMEGSKDKSREQQVSEISRKSKIMAKELDIPVMQLAQLNRSVEMRGGNKKPMLSDLRESGAIEQDADIVLFLYRAEYYGIGDDENGNSTNGIGTIIVAKHRNGSTGEIMYRYNRSITRYYDYDADSQFNAIDFPVISSEEPF